MADYWNDHKTDWQDVLSEDYFYMLEEYLNSKLFF